MPASCASISGIARSTFDLNSVRFLRCRFTRGRLFHPAGLRSSALSFLSRWSMTIHIYVRAIRIPVSGGREKVRLASLRKGIRTMMTDTTVSIWGNFPFA
ncbi:hypothetical protein ALC62_11633 [Cyphomyrmex costatus]|uniref:Uncharacterized protein n=1 Tax=Cyphomyrmex costatus TaxID=456900 RepID=A0A151ICN8_9HYME|nr:hypothetical protein ALC62_11633 [Cyphomyrmex costatus]